MDLLTFERKGGTWTCGYVYLCSELYAFCIPVLSPGMMVQISKNVDFMFPLFLSCHTESFTPGPHNSRQTGKVPEEPMKMTKGLESLLFEERLKDLHNLEKRKFEDTSLQYLRM